MDQAILDLISGVKAAAAGQMVSVPRDVLLAALSLLPGVAMDAPKDQPDEDVS